MKRLVIFSALLVLGSALTLPGFRRPDRESLPNFDKRLQRAAQVQELPPGKKEAAARLQQRLPGVKVTSDPLLKGPNFVADPRGFLTAPNGQAGRGLSDQALRDLPANDQHRPVKAFLNEHSKLFGYDAEVLQTTRLKTDYVDSHNGLRTTIWQQELDGIPVFEGILKTHLTRHGELVNVTTRLLPAPAQAADRGVNNRRALQNKPSVSAQKAVVLAAKFIGEDLAEEDLSEKIPAAGAHKKQQLKADRGVKGETYVELAWLPVDDTALTLCWNIILTSRSTSESFLVLIDAATGDVWLRKSLTRYISDASYRVWTSDSPSPFTPSLATPGNFQPPVVPRTLIVTNAFSTNASPLGWINDGNNDTMGNNVQAQSDLDGDDNPDLPRPAGNPTRVFDFPVDLTLQPSNYTAGTVVQMFYLANVYHDRLYDLGFTEAAGNYQTTNFGRGGLENDAIIADAQDGSGTDNAFFSPAPDGTPGRMTSLIASGPNPMRDFALDAEVMFHEFTHGLTDRLVGGGVGVTYSAQSGGLHEGWSDWYPLTLLSEPSDNVDATYASAAYVSYRFAGMAYDLNYYFGLRRYPYSTDMTKNPLTYKDIDPSQALPHPGIPTNPLFLPFNPSDASEVHNAGEVWTVTMWEVRANLVRKWGWSVGNQMALQLAVDSMKLCPVDPDYLQARDAIVQADLVNNGGANFDEIWAGFAKRGMGSSAYSPGSSTTVGIIEAYDLPGLAVQEFTPVDAFTGNANGVVDINECLEMTITLVNNARETASNVTALLVTSTPGVNLSQSVSPYFDVPPGIVVTNLIPFKFYTTPTFVCGSTIDFSLIISSSKEIRTNTFRVTTGTPATPVKFDNNNSVQIPNLNTTGVLSPITVSGFSSGLSKVTVSLHIKHTFDYDLKLFLIGPDGTKVTLSSRHGPFGQDYGLSCAPEAARTTFDDKAFVPIASGAPPYAGSFKPDQSLAVFNGKSGVAVNGVWKLQVVDDYYFGTGSLECWSLHLSPTTCAEGTGDCETDLAITGSSFTPAMPIVGSNMVITLQLTNFGPNAARGVTMTDTLPPGMTVINAASTQGTCTTRSNQVICNVGTLPNAGGATIDLTVRPSLPGLCTNLATVASLTPDINSTNNISTLEFEVFPPRPIIVSAGARLVPPEGFQPGNGGIDPNETVTINFALRNVGALSTSNLVATLLNANGVTAASAPQLYGNLNPGGPAASNQFTFTASGPSGGPLTATFQLQDGTNDLGFVRFPYTLSGTHSFTNQSVIIVRDNTNAAPYPSPIFVSEVSGGLLRKVTVTLFNVNHNNPEQLDLLLVGPNGKSTLLMSDVGLYSQMANVTLTFEDGGQALPRIGQVLPGTYAPTNYTRTPNNDIFLAPAPAAPYGANLSVFNGGDPNGVWELYVMDDTLGEAGRISGGWAINLHMVDYVNPAPDIAVLASSSPAAVNIGDTITYSIIVTNLGPDTANSVILTNTLPANCAFVSATNLSGGSCVNVGRGVSCQLGVMTNLARANILITALAGLPSSATNSGSVSNYVKVSTSDLDPNLSNNSTAVLNTVNALADLALSIQAFPDPATINQDLAYAITVTNCGPNIASGVVLSNWLPSGAAFISASPDRGTWTETNGLLVWSIGSLNPAAKATAAVIVKSPSVGVLTNLGLLSAALPLELVQTNNSARLVTYVNNPALIINPVGAVMVSENGPRNGALDVGETVTLAFSLRNVGIASTADLIATLLPGNGVAAPSAPRSYGVLSPGGLPVARSFTFTVEGTNGSAVSAVLQLRDGATDLGTATFNFVIGLSGQFDATASAILSDLAPATLYPAVIAVSNLVGVVEKVTVTVNGLSHTYPADIDMVLVGPEGQSTLLMSDTGGGTPISNLALTFDDTAATALPQSPLASGAFKPTNYGSTPDAFPAPAPEGPYGNLLSTFAGTRPNGNWSLFIVDDSFGDLGSWNGGWSLSLVTAGRIETVSQTANVTLPVVLLPDGQVQLTIQGTPGADYIIFGSSDLKTWTPLTTNTLDSASSVVLDPNLDRPSVKFYRATLQNP